MSYGKVFCAQPLKVLTGSFLEVLVFFGGEGVPLGAAAQLVKGAPKPFTGIFDLLTRTLVV